jgi:sodium-independent sulfate anion transporter 11
LNTDVTIGPTAVLSLIAGQTISSNLPTGTPDSQKAVFAVTLAFATGVVQTVLGAFRLGIIVDFVPISVISGFTTGAGIQIIIGQMPSIFGIKGIDTNQAAFNALINFLPKLPSTSRNDAVFGLTAYSGLCFFLKDSLGSVMLV